MLKKIGILITILLVFSTSSYAKTLSNELEQCVKVQDDLSRLSCFDRLSLTSKNTVEIKESPTQVQKEARFGGDKIEKKKQQDSGYNLEKVIYTVAKINKSIRKKLTIHFENGQVWKQNDTITLRLKKEDNVEISAGMLGSFFLKKINTNRAIRVKRIK
ncbi:MULTISPECIES: hypothetical protein [unclassified Colwellia]|jgi:hypothetical protein|uniref:hypothetical protein n=1 Tax=unclassified Colwellia TaxID=196834 RepID=UPI0015F715F1|nr:MULTISPECIES: hypothetical protein [unclassified Colwellia]MBA6253593.1 hypothetical protein [Colwellia sp. MB3u-55]MBA6397453.1 hypothetical protein [Colwellia sp. BRX10-4]